jgi:hypothetical protein
VELYGSGLVMNTHLRIALAVLSLLALGLLVRTSARRRHWRTSSRWSCGSTKSAVRRPSSTTYRRIGPRPPELRYFRTQFVVKHFSRVKATVQREYPDSLVFLDHALADATMAQNDQTRDIGAFLTSPSDEIDIVVQNVSLSELTTPPYKASVAFQKVLYTPGTRVERERQTHVAQVDFVMCDRVPNGFVRVNPLGLQITYFRVDQAFEETRR